MTGENRVEVTDTAKIDDAMGIHDVFQSCLHELEEKVPADGDTPWHVEVSVSINTDMYDES